MDLEQLLTEPSARFYALKYLVEKLGCSESFVTDHPNVGSVLIPQAITPDGSSTFYFLKTPENLEYIQEIGVRCEKQ